MTSHTFTPHGVCSRKIEYDLDEEGRIHNLRFEGGCNGNLKAIGKLVEGKEAAEIRNLLLGNTCGFKDTSCADQLARALTGALEKENA